MRRWSSPSSTRLILRTLVPASQRAALEEHAGNGSSVASSLITTETETLGAHTSDLQLDASALRLDRVLWIETRAKPDR